MQQIRLRTKAKSDLCAVVSYTRQQWGEEKVIEIETIIRGSFELIVRAPYLGRRTREESVFVKTLPRVPFVIVYKVSADYIYILRIMHTKRNR
jgi:plasmid stabilization system protein ParE